LATLHKTQATWSALRIEELQSLWAEEMAASAARASVNAAGPYEDCDEEDRHREEKVVSSSASRESSTDGGPSISSYRSDPSSRSTRLRDLSSSSLDLLNQLDQIPPPIHCRRESGLGGDSADFGDDS
ncbi:unnamed protein product, partial [Mycena citricolor]